MLNARLYFIQRLSAMVLAPLVLGHLLGMILAIQGGLDAAEILSRTQGSVWWGLFYGLFVVAAGVHAAIGLRVIACEWLRLAPAWLDAFTWIAGLVLIGLGSRAVVALVL